MTGMSLKSLLLVACGGALGAVLRYTMTSAANLLWGKDFPYGTLSVNIIGSFLIGLVIVWSLHRAHLGDFLSFFVIIGVFGALTTFSSFSMETVSLIEMGRYTLAMTNIAANVLICLSATAAGLWLGRALFA